MAPTGLVPGETVPDLAVRLIIDQDWSLKKQRPKAFTMIVFYRGRHCPVCGDYLAALARRVDDLAERGVAPIAVSMDPEDQAKAVWDEWGTGDLPIGYGLDEETARAWGLYLSDPIKDDETNRFCEPGLFLVRPDGTLYFASVQTLPFARPPIDELVSAIDFVQEKDYPARGEAA